jgi:hypothetical protein
MNTKVREKALRLLLRKIERQEGAAKCFDELIRRRIAAKDPEALVSAFILNKPDIEGPDYWDEWDREIEAAATNLEAAGAFDDAKSIREFKPIHVDQDEDSPVFDVEALRDQIKTLLGDGVVVPQRKIGRKRGRKLGDRKPDKEENAVVKAHRHGQNHEVTAKLANVFTKDGRPDTRRVNKILRAHKKANQGHKFPPANS